jgi:hypothetical protein
MPLRHVGIAPQFLTSALDGGEWSASRHGCFTPGGRDAGTHWIGGWLGPRIGLDVLVLNLSDRLSRNICDL